jgi:hypothetical protein
MDFKRRLTLFAFGIGLGCILAWGIFGKRLTNTAWLPNERVKLRLINTLTEATPQAQAMLTPLQLSLADLRASMDSCDVDFSQSKRSKDSLIYAVHGTVHGEAVSFMVGTLRDFRTDSTATLMEIRRERR